MPEHPPRRASSAGSPYLGVTLSGGFVDHTCVDPLIHVWLTSSGRLSCSKSSSFIFKEICQDLHYSRAFSTLRVPRPGTVLSPPLLTFLLYRSHQIRRMLEYDLMVDLNICSRWLKGKGPLHPYKWTAKDALNLSTISFHICHIPYCLLCKYCVTLANTHHTSFTFNFIGLAKEIADMLC